MTARYFVAPAIDGSVAQLTGPEAHHFLHVMRGKVGDSVTLFDGTGHEYTAQVAQVSRRDVELSVQRKERVSRESALPLTLAVALPKGERQNWLIEKAVELGVTALVPLVTERSQVKITPAVLERLRRGVIESAKQCERNLLMTIAEPTPWGEFAAQNLTGAKIIAVPGATEPLSSTLLQEPEQGAIVAIGPEGDWSPAEVQLAGEHGWQRVSLGPRILRVETAAILAAGLLIGTQ